MNARYVHASPPGWRTLSYGEEMVYVSPDGRATISVLPVIDLQDGDSAQAAATLVPNVAGRVRALIARPGLGGNAWLLPGSQSGMQQHLVALRDGRFIYAARAEIPTGDQTLEHIFACFVRSIEPMPRFAEGTIPNPAAENPPPSARH